MSGIWVEEGFYECGEYLAEKCYRLDNKSDDKYITLMKGLNATFQKEYHLYSFHLKNLSSMKADAKNLEKIRKSNLV